MHHKTFIDEVKTAIQIALFKEKDMHHIAGDKKKMQYAFCIIIAGSLLSMLGIWFLSPFHPKLISSIFAIIVQIAMVVIGIYVISFIAKKFFRGHAKHDEFFRVTAYATIVGWLGFIPILGLISGLWGLALLFVILKTIHKIKTGEAVLSIIIGMIALMIISMIFSPFYGIKKEHMSNKNPDYKMNFNNKDALGSFNMEDGKMRVETKDGTFEMNIPEY